MFHYQGHPSEGMSQAGFGPTIDPTVVFGWFGADFVLLETPDIRERYVERFFEGSTSGARTQSGQTGPHRPVHVSIANKFGNGHNVVVRTRRLYGDETENLADHLWATLVDFLLAAAKAPASWPDCLPPEDIQRRLDPRLMPVDVSHRAVSLDGVEQRWQEIPSADLVTNEPVAACGSRIGNNVISVAALSVDLRNLVLRTYPPRVDIAGS